MSDLNPTAAVFIPGQPGQTAVPMWPQPFMGQAPLDTLLAYNQLLNQHMAAQNLLKPTLAAPALPGLPFNPAAGLPVGANPFAAPSLAAPAAQVLSHQAALPASTAVPAPVSAAAVTAAASSAAPAASASAIKKPQKTVEVVVCTPWYSEGVNKHDVTLHDEVLCFSEFIRLSARESSLRHRAVSRIGSAANAVFGAAASAAAYGSLHSRTITSSSAVDVCVDACGTGAVTAARVRTLLAECGCDLKGVFAEAPGGNGFCQAVDRASAVTMNVMFYQDKTPACADASHAAASWVAEYPDVQHAHAVLRQVLNQTGNLDVAKGGLSAYCLLAMVVAYCRTEGKHAAASRSAPGTLLFHACRVFGTSFNYETTAICPRRGFVEKTAAMKSGTPSAVFVCDPLDETNNLAAGADRLFAIKAQLSHCHKALQRWEEPIEEAFTPTSSNAALKKGYRGRTPLSGIISHQKLWGRATEQEDERQAAREEEEEEGMPELDDARFGDDEGDADADAHTDSDSDALCSGGSTDSTAAASSLMLKTRSTESHPSSSSLADSVAATTPLRVEKRRALGHIVNVASYESLCSLDDEDDAFTADQLLRDLDAFVL